MSTGTGSNRSGAAGSVAAAAATAAPAEEEEEEEEEEELEAAELEDEDEDEEEDEEAGNPVRAFFGGRGMPSGGGDVGGELIKVCYDSHSTNPVHSRFTHLVMWSFMIPEFVCVLTAMYFIIFKKAVLPKLSVFIHHCIMEIFSRLVQIGVI